MKLDDIINNILAQSGEYIVAENVDQLVELQLDRDKIWRMIEKELLDYQRYKPVTKQFNIDMPKNVYSFEDAPTNGTNGPPIKIVKVVPVGWMLAITRALWLTPFQFRAGYNHLYKTIDPQQFLWNYIDNWVDPDGVDSGPILVCSQMGKVHVTAIYGYSYKITRDANKKVIDVDIPELDELQIPPLWDILMARFISAVGRSRRAFTYTDLPVTTDAADLVREGQELYEKAREGLYNRSDWWKGVTIP